MSVDYEAFIGIGWVMSAEERDRLVEANLRLIEEYPNENIPCVEDEFSYIDCYYDESDVFLGKSIASINCGSYMNLTAIGSFITSEELDEFILTYEKVFEACGEPLGMDSKWYNPQIYLIHRVW
jgi:hypothetical protein